MFKYLDCWVKRQWSQSDPGVVIHETRRNAVSPGLFPFPDRVPSCYTPCYCSGHRPYTEVLLFLDYTMVKHSPRLEAVQEEK